MKLETHLEPFVDSLNSAGIENVEVIERANVDPTMGNLLDRFIAHESLLEIKARKPGERTESKG